MSLYGAIASLYSCNPSNPLQEKEYISDITISMPNVDGSGNPPYYQYLYNPAFIPATASLLDGYVSSWQLGTLFYTDNGYTGKVPVTDVINLFPTKYNLTEYFADGRAVMLIPENSDYGYVLFKDPNAIAIRQTGEVYNVVTGSFVGQSAMPVGFCLSFYGNNVITLWTRKTTSGIVTTYSFKSGVYLGERVSITTLLTGFFESYNDDFVPPLPSSDPFFPGGESDTGGGTGNFDGTSVDVDFSSLPNLSAVDTGFISLYNPTLAQLQSLANYMWSDLFDLDTFKKLFGDPMQAILGLSIVPGPVPSGGTQTVKVGNISTGISMTRAASQYIDVDCGTLNVEEFWGAYLDYEPYTKAEIYLPYIGTHQIAVDDIMGKAVHIKYHIDILSGACAAEIKCGSSVLYTFIGSVAVSIPITGNDWTNVINGVLSIAGAVGSMVATGGASAPAAAGEIASAAVNSLKPNIEKSGSVSGGGGLLAGKVPVLILTRPRQALPASQNEFTGYPAFITRSLGAVSGYTEVHKIRLGGISATDAELDEIENLFKGGVIL